MAAASNDFKAIAAQKRSKPSARKWAFHCPRLESREPETRGIPIFCNPEKRCLSRRRTCKHLTSCFAKSFLELETAAMSKRTREKKRKAQSLEQLAKPDEISISQRFAQSCGKARLLIDHPHSYREWNIIGQCDVPGFFYLESRFRLNPGEQPALYTAFELCLHESQFEKV
jgi:hypothetical protein